MPLSRTLKNRLLSWLFACFLLFLLGVIAALVRPNPKPLNAEDARIIEANHERIEQFISRDRAAIPQKSSSIAPRAADQITTSTQAGCDETYLALIVAIDRLASRSQLATNATAREELLTLARRLGNFYDQRMTISRSVRCHRPKHVQILYDLGRLLMETEKKTLLTTNLFQVEMACARPESRAKLYAAQPIDLLRRQFEAAAKMFYVIDLAVPCQIEYHDYPACGDHPVMRATENLLRLYAIDPAHFGPMLTKLNPELVARRHSVDLGLIMGELIESSEWVSRQYYEHSSSWSRAYGLYKIERDDPRFFKVIPDYLHTAWLLWNRDDKMKVESAWLAEVAARADTLHTFNDFANSALARTDDPDIANGFEPFLDCLLLLERSRLEAAAIELIQGKKVPTNAAPDSYFYNPFEGHNIYVVRTDSTVHMSAHMILRVTEKSWAVQASSLSVQLPQQNPALASIPTPQPPPKKR